MVIKTNNNGNWTTISINNYHKKLSVGDDVGWSYSSWEIVGPMQNIHPTYISPKRAVVGRSLIMAKLFQLKAHDKLFQLAFGATCPSSNAWETTMDDDNQWLC